MTRRSGIFIDVQLNEMIAWWFSMDRQLITCWLEHTKDLLVPYIRIIWNCQDPQKQLRSFGWVFYQAKWAFTNWSKTTVVLKSPDNIFCHVRKLPPDKFQMRQFGSGREGLALCSSSYRNDVTPLKSAGVGLTYHAHATYDTVQWCAFEIRQQIFSQTF